MGPRLPAMRVPIPGGRASSLLQLLRIIASAVVPLLPLTIGMQPPGLRAQELLRHSAAGEFLLSSPLLSARPGIPRYGLVPLQWQKRYPAAVTIACNVQGGVYDHSGCFSFVCRGPMAQRTPLNVAAAAASRHAVLLTSAKNVGEHRLSQQQSIMRPFGFGDLTSSLARGDGIPWSSRNEKQKRRISTSNNSNSSHSLNPEPHVHDLRILEGLFYSPRAKHSRTFENASSSRSPASSGPISDPVAEKEGGRVILLVLNQPVPSYFGHLLQGVSLVIAADGATNHLLPIYREAEDSLLRQQQQPPFHMGCNPLEGRISETTNSRTHPHSHTSTSPLSATVGTPRLPACICGDIDSSKPEALAFFESRGVPVIRMEDQDKTDLEKSFAFALQKYDLSPQDTVLVVGAIGGRFDHSIASVSFLYKIHNLQNGQTRRLPNVVLLGGSNACILLEEGDNEVILSDAVFSPSCALLPMGVKARRVKSEGLRWNIKGRSLCMSGLISSSNRRTSDRIHVSTTDSLLFFCELNEAVCPIGQMRSLS